MDINSQTIRAFLARLHLLCFPPACHACDRLMNPLGPRHGGFPFLCAGCMETLPWKIPARTCRRCGSLTAEEDRLPCPVCAGRSMHLHRVWCTFHYADPVRRWIWELKYHGREPIVPMLGRLMNRATLGGDPLRGVHWVVPVPLHLRRLRQRGFNQSLLLADALLHEALVHEAPVHEALLHEALLHEALVRGAMQDAARLQQVEPRGQQGTKGAAGGDHIPSAMDSPPNPDEAPPQPRPQLRPQLLVRTRNTRPQMELPAEERMANVEDAFSLAPGQEESLAGRNILLVDDMLTTGATLNACAKTLLDAGAHRVEALVLGRA